jgi:hypothetical protein
MGRGAAAAGAPDQLRVEQGQRSEGPAKGERARAD